MVDDMPGVYPGTATSDAAMLAGGRPQDGPAEEVWYLDSLWKLIEPIRQPLHLVLRTDVRTFDVVPPVPVRVWWSHGPSRSGQPERSALVVDVPDEIYRRIQSDYVGTVCRRWFGMPAGILPAPIRPRLDAQRQWREHFGLQAIHEVIVDDWPRLRQAIQASAYVDPSYQARPQLRVLIDGFGPAQAAARVRGNLLEVYVGHLVHHMHREWAQSFRREALFE